MVYGNMGDGCATGVAFTRDPSTGERQLYGEFLINAQGEDVVAGIRTPQPLSELSSQMPQVYEQFQGICAQLEPHYRDMQDVEFTVQKGKLWMLPNSKRQAHRGGGRPDRRGHGRRGADLTRGSPPARHSGSTRPGSSIPRLADSSPQESLPWVCRPLRGQQSASGLQRRRGRSTSRRRPEGHLGAPRDFARRHRRHGRRPRHPHRTRGCVLSCRLVARGMGQMLRRRLRRHSH